MTIFARFLDRSKADRFATLVNHKIDAEATVWQVPGGAVAWFAVRSPYTLSTSVQVAAVELFDLEERDREALERIDRLTDLAFAALAAAI